MNSGIDPIQLASTGAQVLVAEMVKSSWASFRGKLSKVFQRTGDAAHQLELVDTNQQELLQASEDDKQAVETRLLTRWQLQLAALLDQYPEASQDLLELVESSTGSRDQSGQHTLAAFGNTASQIVQTAGDIQTGGGDISFTRPKE